MTENRTGKNCKKQDTDCAEPKRSGDKKCRKDCK